MSASDVEEVMPGPQAMLMLNSLLVAPQPVQRRFAAAIIKEFEQRDAPCQWSQVEVDSADYNTCKEGEEWHLPEGLDLFPHCHWCGRRIEVVPL